MTITAAPFAAKSNKACRMAAAAAASTPQVGWFTTKTSGLCKTSRPMTNFCKLPPERERAALAALGVRTSKAPMMRSAKRWLAFFSETEGTSTVDHGAVKALCEQGKSLLIYSIIAFIAIVALWGIVQFFITAIGINGDEAAPTLSIPAAGA